MNKYTTIVIRMPEDSEGQAQVAAGLKLLQPHQTGMSLEDEMTLLERIEAHEDFPAHIAEEARAAMKASSIPGK